MANIFSLVGSMAEWFEASFLWWQDWWFNSRQSLVVASLDKLLQDTVISARWSLTSSQLKKSEAKFKRKTRNQGLLLSESVFVLCIAPTSLSRDRKINMKKSESSVCALRSQAERRYLILSNHYTNSNQMIPIPAKKRAVEWKQSNSPRRQIFFLFRQRNVHAAANMQRGDICCDSFNQCGLITQVTMSSDARHWNHARPTWYFECWTLSAVNRKDIKSMGAVTKKKTKKQSTSNNSRRPHSKGNTWLWAG